MLTEVIRYDRKGRKTEDVTYGEGGKSTRQEYLYDKDSGNLTETLSYDENGLLVSRCVFAASGAIYSESCYDAHGVVTEREVCHSEAGRNQAEQDSYDSQGPLAAKVIFTYDPAHRVRKMKFYANKFLGNGRFSASRSLAGEADFRYDTRGHPLQMDSYGPTGTLLHKSVFEYKDKSSISEDTSYGPDGSVIDKQRTRVDEMDPFGHELKVTKLKWVRSSDTFEPTEVTYSTYTYYRSERGAQ